MGRQVFSPMEVPGSSCLPVKRRVHTRCRKLFKAHRRDARICSSTCRSRASRDKTRQAADLPGGAPGVLDEALFEVPAKEEHACVLKPDATDPVQPAFIPLLVRGDELAGRIPPPRTKLGGYDDPKSIAAWMFSFTPLHCSIQVITIVRGFVEAHRGI